MDSEMDIDSVIGQAMGDEPVETQEEVITPEIAEEPEAQTEEVVETPVVEELKFSPPDKWSGFAKTKFQMLPKEVQKELTDYHNTVEAQQKVYNALDETIGEHKQAVTATYGSVENMFKHYMQLDQFAAKDPAGLVKWFCQQRGIDPQTLFGQQPASGQVDQTANGAPQNPAEIEALVQKQVDDKLAERQASQMIADFSKNTEKYPYFNDVRDTMSKLMFSDQATDMEGAYNKAIRLHDDIFAQVQEQEFLKRSQEQQKSTMKAKQAATIKSAPGLSSSRKSSAVNLDDIIQESMAVRV